MKKTLTLMTIVLFLFVSTIANAGLKEVKEAYERKVKALKIRYIENLKRERQFEIRRGKSTVEIDKEISRINGVLHPMPKKMVIKYSNNATRIYEFRSESQIYFHERRQFIPYVRNGDVVIINHPNGTVETWERLGGDKWRVNFKSINNLELSGEANKG